MKKFMFFIMLTVVASLATLPLYAQNGVDHGHRYVDLGLPSGTKWADCNIGAATPTDYGDLFAWGEIVQKNDYALGTYKYGVAENKLTKYCTDSENGQNGFKDNKSELDLADDVARQKWGGAWRMPSKEQCVELMNNTSIEWTTISGVNGLKFTGLNGQYIFFPAAGYRNSTRLVSAGSYGACWSRTLDAGNPCCAYGLDFYMDDVDVSYGRRCYGHSVRPIRP